MFLSTAFHMQHTNKHFGVSCSVGLLNYKSTKVVFLCIGDY